MGTFTIIINVFFIIWLFVVAFLMWQTWRTSTKRTQLLEQTLADVALKSAEAVKNLSKGEKP